MADGDRPRRDQVAQVDAHLAVALGVVHVAVGQLVGDAAPVGGQLRVVARARFAGDHAVGVAGLGERAPGREVGDEHADLAQAARLRDRRAVLVEGDARAVGGDRRVVRPVGDRHDRRAGGARPRRPVVAALAEPAGQLGELTAQETRALRARHRAAAHGAGDGAPERGDGGAAHRHGAAAVHPPDVERAVLLDAQIAEALGRDAEDRRRVALDRPLVQRVEVDVLREVALDDDPVRARPQLP